MESRRLVPLSAIPMHLRNAVLAAEDSRFYTHFGIDIIGVGRALRENLRRMRIVQGGSTITQQLAKNFFLSPKRSRITSYNVCYTKLLRPRCRPSCRRRR